MLKEFGEAAGKTWEDAKRALTLPAYPLRLFPEHLAQGRGPIRGLQHDTRQSIGGLFSLAVYTPLRFLWASAAGSARLLGRGLLGIGRRAEETRKQIGNAVPGILQMPTAPPAEGMKRAA